MFQLTFDEFRVGTLHAGQCIGGEMQILELGRPYVGGSWCGGGGGGGSGTPPAVYYSEAGTVTLTLRVPHGPNRYSVGMEPPPPPPFAFAIRYRFLDGRRAAVRLGTAAEPKDRGELVPGTRCSRNFYECYRTRCAVQSPNYPGLYPRNATCRYTVRQETVPKCKHAMVSVTGVTALTWSSQHPLGPANESTRSVADGACTGADDRLTFHDGPSERDPVLLTFCGGPSVPRVVASGPVMLIVFHSSGHGSPAAVAATSSAHRLVRGFELDARIAFVDSDSLDYARGGACEFVINSSAAGGRWPRRGALVGPQHSVPANSTCTYRFQGQPDDRVWMYFESYGRRRNAVTGSGDPCPTRLRVWDGGAGTLLADHCDAPRLCEHHANAVPNGTRPKRPCTPDESYVSESASVILQVHTAPGTVLEPFAFRMRYEFVDTATYGGRGACVIDRTVRRSTDVAEPRNVFLYGRGGAKDLDCVYRLRAEPGYRMQIVLHNASFGTTARECPTAGKLTCPDRVGGPELIVREVFWRTVKIDRGCFCQNFTEHALGAQRVTFDPSSDTVEIQFRVPGMAAADDFSNTYFNAHVRVYRSPPCPRNQRVRGAGGEIELTYPPVARDDLYYCRDRPWLLEARPGHSVFVHTWGHFLPLPSLPPNGTEPAAVPCKTRNRILLYALRPVRLIRHVCPANGRDDRRNTYVFSDEWTDSAAAAVDGRRHGPGFVVEFVAPEPGSMAFKWLEVSKPKHVPLPSPRPPSDRSVDGVGNGSATSPRRRFGCAYGCPELDACISASLWCDGHRNCPSGVDEADPECRRAEWPAFEALRSYGLPAAGVGLAGVASALLACLYCGCGRGRGRDHYDEHYDDEPAETAAAAAAAADSTRSCSTIAS